MKKIDGNTWFLIMAVLLFVGGAILMGLRGESLASLGPCCF